jgi:hypothetical protein
LLYRQVETIPEPGCLGHDAVERVAFLVVELVAIGPSAEPLTEEEVVDPARTERELERRSRRCCHSENQGGGVSLVLSQRTRMRMMRNARTKRERYLLWATSASLALAALAAMIAVFIGDFTETTGKIALSFLLLAWAISHGGRSLKGYDRPERMAHVTASISLGGLVLLIIGVEGMLFLDMSSFSFGRVALAGVALTSGGFVALRTFLNVPDKPSGRFLRQLRVLVRWLALALGFLIAIMVFVFENVDDVPILGWRLLVVALIALGSGALLIPILARLEPNVALGESMNPDAKVDVTEGSANKTPTA